MRKTSIVLELQHDALNENVKAPALLRKALVVAKKLNLHDFSDWVAKELAGYKPEENIPEYRKFQGQINARSMYTAWYPITIEDPVLAKEIIERYSIQSIPEIQSLADQISTDKYVEVQIKPHHQKIIRNQFGNDIQLSLHVSYTYLLRPLELVRDIILNWTLKLEEQGILGEGLTFTRAEIESAVHVPQNINNFYGPVDKAQVQQGTIDSTQIAITELLDIDAIKTFLKELDSRASELGLDGNINAELHAELRTLRAQVESPKPKTGIIIESLKSLRTILEGAGGTVAGQLLIELGRLFS